MTLNGKRCAQETKQYPHPLHHARGLSAAVGIQSLELRALLHPSSRSCVGVLR